MHHHKSNSASKGASQEPARRGPSSFTMQGPEVVFGAMELGPGQVLADLGCGPGDYSLAAAKIVGPEGKVLALDHWQAMVEGLIARAAEQGLANLEAKVVDLGQGIPLPDASADVCFMATVMHALDLQRDGKTIFTEMRRVLKPHGRAVILNCKKEEQPWGPSLEQRLSPQQVEDWMTPYGFQTLGVIDLGFNYLIQFRPI